VYVTSNLGHATRILDLLSASGRNDYGQCLFLQTKEQVSDYRAVISKLEYFNYWYGCYTFIFSLCFKDCCIYFHNHEMFKRFLDQTCMVENYHLFTWSIFIIYFFLRRGIIIKKFRDFHGRNARFNAANLLWFLRYTRNSGRSHHQNQTCLRYHHLLD
jgi:hypothetical protein